jgi:hypothetical protein
MEGAFCSKTLDSKKMAVGSVYSHKIMALNGGALNADFQGLGFESKLRRRIFF